MKTVARKTKPPAKKTGASKKTAAARKPSAGGKASVAAKTSAAKKTARKAAPAKKTAGKSAPAYGRRADFGAPIDTFFAKQPAHLRTILEALRALVEEVAPDAAATIKWGMPFYSIDGAMMCALSGHKSHVGLILSGPPGSFDDPEGHLEGDAKTGRRMRLASLDELPRQAARGWLVTAARLAREKGA